MALALLMQAALSFYDLFEGGDFGAGVNVAFTNNIVSRCWLFLQFLAT